MVIDSFRGEYAFLSNFYESAFGFNGWPCRTAEHAFQAMKCLEREDAKRVLAATTPAQAKRIGRVVALRYDWEQVKDDVMQEVLAAKFAPGTALAARLLATDDAQLVEGNTWGDTYWGVDARTGAGRNQLGRALMEQRSRLRGGRTS